MSVKILKSWMTAAGLKAEVRQGFVLCGYVAVEKDHPLFERHYDEVDVEVHGGLTYAAREGDLWWFGFDTGHFGDALPGLDGRLKGFKGVPGKVWTVEQVAEETEKLAQHIARKGRKNPYR